jgi:hypothetical protein
MSVAKPLLALLAGLLLAAPVGTAYVQPVFYFLKDAPGATDPIEDAVPPLPVPIPVPIPVPTLDLNAGILDPYDRNLGNAPNSTTAKARVITPGTEAVVPVQFVTPGEHSHPDRIKGPLFVGLWTGESTVMNGNLTATLYEFKADGSPGVALANASVVLDLNQSKLPSDPTVLIPANQTDPQAIAFYELAQVLPLLLHPPALFILGPIDIAFDPASSFAIGFAMTQGSSPTPLPLGATATIQYDGAFAPSFVYVPWYAPDPPRPTSTYRPPTYTSGPRGTTSFGSIPTEDSVIVGDDDKDTPAFGAGALLLALLAVAAFAARRRAK